MADKMAALKNKSFGKTLSNIPMQKVFSPSIPPVVHNDSLNSPAASDEVENLVNEIELRNINAALGNSYSREDMLSLKDSKNKDEWTNYAKNKSSDWDVKNSPFEFDQELRVPFELQIRVNRKREEEQLKKRQELLGIKTSKVEATKEETPTSHKKVYPSAVIGSTIPKSLISMDEPSDVNSICKLISDFTKKFKSAKILGPACFFRATPSVSNVFQLNNCFIKEEMPNFDESFINDSNDQHEMLIDSSDQEEISVVDANIVQVEGSTMDDDAIYDEESCSKIDENASINDETCSSENENGEHFYVIYGKKLLSNFENQQEC
jgi:hypothetical protein